MSWFLLVIISVLTTSFTRVLQKILLKNKNNNPVAFASLFCILAGIIMFVWAFIEGLTIPNLTPLIPNLIAMTLFYSLGNLFLFNAYKIAEASEIAVLFASSAIWSVLSAVVFLGEQITVVKIIATFLIILGVVVVSYTKSGWKLNRGHLFALLSAICFGIAFTNDALIVTKFPHVSSYIFIVFLLPSLAILFFQPKAVGQLKYYFKKGVWLKIGFTSLLYGISSVTLLQAYKNGGQASVISPIAQTTVLTTVIFSFLFLKERDRLLNKIVGAILIFCGVFLLR